MHITIIVREDGAANTEMQETILSGELFTVPRPVISPNSEVPAGQIFDAGAATITVEGGTKPSETTANANINDSDGGAAPQIQKHERLTKE